MQIQKPSHKSAAWRSLIFYMLVTPAALQALSRIDEHFEFSALLGRLLREWRAFVHGLWTDLAAMLQSWINLHPSANQIDALSWIFLMLGAAATSAAFGPSKLAQRANAVQAAVLFWFSFCIVAAIFLRPYVPALVHFLSVGAAQAGLVRTLSAAILTVAVIAFAGFNIVEKIKQARAAREGADDLTPFWSDIEALVGPLVVGGVVGAILALPIMESEAAVERAAARSSGAPEMNTAAHNLLSQARWEEVAAPVVMMVLFSLSLLLLRRYNWPTMVRQVATALGIVIADRLIMISGPLWRDLAAWFAA